jgi:hypothetical protein
VIITPGEQRVRFTGFQHKRTWRQLVSCVVAYAFALQLVLFGFAAASALAHTADQDVLAAGLCLHAAGAPLAPADNPGADEHCKFCPVGGHPVFTAPAMAHQTIVRTAEAAAPPAADQLVSRSRAHAAAQPRGPPPTA